MPVDHGSVNGKTQLGKSNRCYQVDDITSVYGSIPDKIHPQADQQIGKPKQTKENAATLVGDKFHIISFFGVFDASGHHIFIKRLTSCSKKDQIIHRICYESPGKKVYTED